MIKFCIPLFQNKEGLRPIYSMSLMIVSLLFLNVELSAVQSYTPICSDRLSETWRWNELEDLRFKDLLCVSEGKEGILWFARAEGVISYDGIELVEYPFPKDWTSLSYVWSIFATSYGDVYVTSPYGIFLLTKSREWKIVLIEKKKRPVFSFAEGKDQTIWLSSDNGIFTVCSNVIQQVKGSYDSITSMTIDSLGRLWCVNRDSSEIGIFTPSNTSDQHLNLVKKIDLQKTEAFRKITLIRSDNQFVWAIWSGSGGEIRRYNQFFEFKSLGFPSEIDPGERIAFFEGNQDQVIVFQPPNIIQYINEEWKVYNANKYPLPSQSHFLIKHSKERLMIGGHQTRIYDVDLSENHWSAIIGLIFVGNDLSENEWFFSHDKKIIRHNPVLDEWISYDDSDNIIDTPNAFLLGNDGCIWISGSHQNKAAICRMESSVWSREVFPNIGRTFSHLSPCELENGDIVFGNGTQQSHERRHARGGVVIFSKSENGFSTNQIQEPLAPIRSAVVVERNDGDIWIGGGGLIQYNDTGFAKHQKMNFPEKCVIDHLAVDQLNNLWIAQWEDSLIKYDGKNWIRYTVADDLSLVSSIYVLIPHYSEGLWLMTGNGIIRYDGNHWSAFPLSDQFSFTREGATLVEATNGDIWINQSDRKWMMNTSEHNVFPAFSHKTLRYRKIREFPETNIVKFERRINSASNAHIEWTGKDPWNDTPSNQLEFSYQISNGEWSPFTKDTYAVIPHLPAGKHTFKVRSRDRDWNIDPSPAVVDFDVIYPLWLQPWFIPLIILISGIFAVLIFIILRQRVSHAIALREYRINFFTNISHELRTPLTVIIGPLESLAKEIQSEKQKRTIDMILRNSQKMMGLINQLLDFRKVELGKLKYNPQQGDIIGFSKDTIYSLTPLWEKKKQMLSVHCSEDSHRCDFDPDKLQRIIDNLLSNAIKYTLDSNS